MESIVEVPPKKSKFKPPVNVHVTSECVRQFKLPQQYPSTVTKLPLTKTLAEKTAVATVPTKSMHNIISALPFPGNMKFVPNKEVVLSKNLQKLKLKAPDGRDLGEVKLVEQGQDDKVQPKKIITYSKANQNSEKAKTWMLKSQQPTETQKPRIKTITKIINSSSSEESAKESGESASSRMVVQVINTSTESGHKIISSSKISPSGAHKSSTQKILSNDNDGDLITKFILENPSILEKQNGQSQVITIKKLSGSQKLIMMQRDHSQLIKSVPEKVMLKPITQTSLKNHNIKNNTENIIFKSSTNGSIIKKRTCSMEDLRNCNSKKQCMEIDLEDSLDAEFLDKEESKRPNLKNSPNQVTDLLPRKNIMVIVPNEAAEELSMTSNFECTNSEKQLEGKQSELSNYNISSDINQLDDFLNEPTNATSNQDSVDVSTEKQSSSEINNEDGDKNNQSQDLLDKFSILKKAVLSVQDANLRAKALKALQDCGIKVKKTVPIKRPVATKTIIDSQTQTEVFSLLKKDELLHITEEKEDLVKIKLTRKLMKQPMNALSVHRSLNKSSCKEDENNEFKIDLDNLLEKLFSNNEGISNVKEAFGQDKVAQARFLLNQLKADYKATQCYDDDGLLGIHRAIMNENIREVQRHILMLKKAKKSIDICTQDDKTSLELAVEYEVNSQIVKILLEAGAQPLSKKPIHDSAIIIAAKKSSKILSLLFQYVNRNQRALLNAKDSEGLAAIHYCAQFGNLEGVTEIVKLGADVNLQDDKSGRTALFYAVDTKNAEVSHDTYNDIAHKLLEYGAISNIPIFSKHSVLSLIDDVKSHSLKIALNKAVK